jgi:RNA polymerase sigma-70 factor (ECF subfamily)
MVRRRAETETLTSLSLISRVRRGDSEAWSRFFALYEPLLRLWCSESGLREPHIDDVQQEIFIAVRKFIDEFKKESEHDSFRAWLRTVTSSKIADFWRKQNPDEIAVGGSDAQKQIAAIPSKAANGQDELSREKGVLYRRAIELMKTDFEDKTWLAFWRTVVDGVSAGDAADELGISRNAVHLAKARVLKRLRQEFVGLIED